MDIQSEAKSKRWSDHTQIKTCGLRFLLREGVDVVGVFAPATKIKTIRLVVALANINNLSMCLMDVKCAFLNGPLD